MTGARQRPRLAGLLQAMGNRYRRAGDFVAARLLTGTRRVLTPFGFELSGGAALANRMMLNGSFEPEETAVLRERLAAADVFVDVGANIGYYTCMARHAGKHVVAIEPQARNLASLYANLDWNGWRDVEVFPVGLAERPGVAQLYGASGPSASLLSGWAQYSPRHVQAIALSTLDILLGDRFAQQRLLIKIDVEGAEFRVLQGAERVLRRRPQPTWLIEVCLREFHPDGENPDFRALFDRFWSAGYEARRANPDGRRVERRDVESWVATGRVADGGFNYLFTPAR